jgi:hypothetical protein
MRDLSQARPTGSVILALVVTTTIAGQAHAGSLTFKVNLQTGVGDSAVPPYISYQSPIQDANRDGWFETVLKITLNGSPYNQAMFQVQYAAAPTGMTVNIGDSSTNNGFGGDFGTQSNDAEINIGDIPGGTRTRDLFIFGKDGTPVNPNPLAQIPNFVDNGVVANLTVRNDFFAWNNNQGSSGNLTSPYRYALNGQPDTEGPVNYDIYAAFNRDIAGSGRFGTGVGQVIITLSSIPEPNSLILLGFGSAGIGIAVSLYRASRRESLVPK